MVKLYYDMLRIRKVQLRIESLYHLDEMKTPIHLCIGQEAVAVGVCANLNQDDYIASTHRGHGHYLAKGGDLKGLIAELYCRETGCSKGRGGSMHLVDVSVGHMGSSSIVGGCIPIGVGLALAIKMNKQNRVSVAFFGDGAADEGVLYESVNFAILKRLPVIFIYENNQFSVCSRVSARQPGEVIFHATPPEQMYTRIVDGNSVLAVYEAAKTAVNRARGGQGPSFIECKTYRVRGHAGSGSDASLGYRTAEEIAEWEAKCPVTTFRDKLLGERLISDQELEEMEKAIEEEIDEAFAFAQSSPLPRAEDLSLYVFKEE
ncbi:MAG: thiamine pyrophosphate-dependent dehydrogenase E1 component subunit alpha [Deltaproteobacteria bacterium]|nr:thiamine pyrophosphate-dependent dehydrogenase E1 component subunit alpha [Deltaproteobacteria bacterium]